MIFQVEGRKRGRIVKISSLFCFFVFVERKAWSFSFVVENLQVCNILVVI